MIQDGIPEWTLERWVSEDFNDAQELGMRMTMELARANARHYQTTAGGSPPTAPLRSHLASGLNIEQTGGATITVNAGILAQQITSSPPLVPAPDTFDSSYRVGLNLSPLTAADPWDGTGSWWLLEAQVQRVTTLSEKRDIYNPAAVPPVFAPSAANLDKRYEAQVVTQWTKDPINFATLLPPNTAGWAPLGAVWRPAVFAAITDADVSNLSVQLEDISRHTTDEGRAVRHNFRCYGDQGIGGAATGFTHCFEAEAGGVHLFAQSEDGLFTTFRDANIEEVASAAALATAFVWGYIYLAPLQDRMPSGMYSGVHHRGAMIISRTPPDNYGRNSGAITAPAPFAENIGVGGAVHVGILRSNGAVTWHPEDVSSSGDARGQKREFLAGTFPLDQPAPNGYAGPGGGPHNLSVAGPGGTEDVPIGVHLKCYIESVVLDDPGALAEAIECVFSMPGDSLVAADYPRMLMSCHSLSAKVFELYPRTAALTLTVTPFGRDTLMAAIALNAANCGANAYAAGLWGWRF